MILLPLISFMACNSSVSSEQNAKEGIAETSFKVYGNCGMCKDRIEKAVNELDGIHKADWDRNTKMLDLQYDESVLELDEIHKAIAGVGHDTEKERADDEVYDNLHFCCQYERTE